MNLENGKTYIVDHQRKGRFAMRVYSQSEEWATGQIVGGTAVAMLKYNYRATGEAITVRKSLLLGATVQP